jgi:hypothetical protein
MLRALFGFLLLSAILFAGLPSARSDVDNTKCFVNTSSDSIDNFHSLRRKIANYNRTTNRMCTEKILFLAFQEYDIVTQETLVIANPTDNDFNGDGWDLSLSGTWADATIDGTKLPRNHCVIEIHSDNVVIRDITIKVYDKDFAICDYGSGNDFSDVTVIQTKLSLSPVAP